jgi:protein ImuA
MANIATAQERLFALREQIARMEGKPLPALAAAERTDAAQDPDLQKAIENKPRLSFGISAVDAALEGGLPLDAITEIRTGRMRDAGAASGFALALSALIQAKTEGKVADYQPVLWIRDVVSTNEAGAPYAVGLQHFGLQHQAFMQASPRRLEDVLWLAEAAVASGALAAVILEVRGNPSHFGLTESRRLSLRAKTAGRPLFLLRHAGEEEASSAAFRLLAEPAPASGRRLPDGSMLGGSIGHPVFRLTLEKSRNPAPFSVLLEWNSRVRQFSPVQEAAAFRDAAEPFAFRNQPAYPGTGFPASADRPDRPSALGAVVAFDRAS